MSEQIRKLVAPRVHAQIRRAIEQMATDDERLGAAKIHEALIKLEKDHELPEGARVPSRRTVSTIAAAARELTDAEKKQRQSYSWPESHESGLLPWEAAPACLELLERSLSRPTNREARWFWRVTLAKPDMPIKRRESAAVGMARIYDPMPTMAASTARGVESELTLGVRIPSSSLKALAVFKHNSAEWQERHKDHVIRASTSPDEDYEEPSEEEQAAFHKEQDREIDYWREMLKGLHDD